jgi:glycosyltransferase involved in cell wall biosynthesis
MRPLSVAFIGTYIPRLCGIATFTHDLGRAVADSSGRRFGEDPRLRVLAMHNPADTFRYGPEVDFVVRQPLKRDYLEAAEFLNISPFDVVSLQHEYGIFGGDDGRNVLDLLEGLRKPVVTTLHTVLTSPSEGQKRVLSKVCEASSAVVVIAKKAVPILREVYGVPEEKVVHIYHGVPDVPYLDPAFYKDQFQVEGKKVLLTFGLIGPGKGIEHAIDAVARVVPRHPNLVYAVLGATHPDVRRHHGEEYRLSLQQRAERLGIQENVVFYDRFVSEEQLTEFLQMADFYITPYLAKEQMSSGTLSFALGCGKAIVSTPYWYAEELLDEGRGLLAPFGDAEAMAECLTRLLDDEVSCNQMRKRAYQFGRTMVWKEIGGRYAEVFQQAAKAGLPRTAAVRTVPGGLPEMRLDHLRRLTDDTGLLQHAVFATPWRLHGYTTDDNARALRFVVRYHALFQDDSVLSMATTYMAFLLDALDPLTNRFRNEMGYDRRWIDEVGSEDCQGRALAALADALVLAPNDAISGIAMELFGKALQPLASFTSPRAWAWVILGCDRYLKRFGGAREVRELRQEMSRRLIRLFDENATPEWPWCEPKLTYDNARLCKALIVGEKVTSPEGTLNASLHSLQWLLDIQTDPGTAGLSLIGNQGWFERGKKKVRFDQQPIEAGALLSACHEALKATGDRKWYEAMRRCYMWFMGANDLSVPLVNFTTHGCHDGLQRNGVSQNQGAESTLSWLGALLRMYEESR